MLTRAGFEHAPSGYRSAAPPVELSSPQGLEASFYPYGSMTPDNYPVNWHTAVEKTKIGTSSVHIPAAVRRLN